VICTEQTTLTSYWNGDCGNCQCSRAAAGADRGRPYDSGLHFFPDADCICDVGGVDVKIMILNQGAVTDFRLNSQCSSGNGAFLQGVAERFGIPLDDIAESAFRARSTPQLSMGWGVFLQSDIVNQQRKGWQADEILAALCAVLPLNVWIYGGLNNMRQVGRNIFCRAAHTRISRWMGESNREQLLRQGSGSKTRMR
jgi:hypothetical protein